MTRWTVFEGIAKPMPCPCEMRSVVMPTIFPRASTSGPPELPGLIGASVWIHRLYGATSRYRRGELMMPSEMDRVNPNGLPSASTNCPGWIMSESVNSHAGSGLCPAGNWIWSSARSVSGSRPTSRAGSISLSKSTHLISVASFATWLFVTTYPSGLMITPLPKTCWSTRSPEATYWRIGLTKTSDGNTCSCA